MGMVWAPHQKQWVEHYPAHDMAHDPVECQAGFVAGLAVCHTGRKVQVKCDPMGSGINVTFTAGCECQGIVARGVVAGHMPEDMSAVCAGTMETWSIRAQEKYMHTEPAERCAALVQTACDAQAAKLSQGTQDLTIMSKVNAERKVVSFNKAMKTIERENNKVRREQDKLREQLLKPLYVYNKVPGFGMPPTPGSVRDAEVVTDCQKDCDQRVVCQSFSFNQKTGKCSWAKHKLDYDDEFELYVKRRDRNAEGGYFTAIPGVKIGVEAQTEMQTSIHECKFNCLMSETCTAFSYAARTETCVQTQVQISVGSDWDYYEKKKILGKGQQDADNANAAVESRRQAQAVRVAVKEYRAAVSTTARQDKETSDRMDEEQAKLAGGHLEEGATPDVLL
jgi:hypothetical protein